MHGFQRDFISIFCGSLVVGTHDTVFFDALGMFFLQARLGSSIDCLLSQACELRLNIVQRIRSRIFLQNRAARGAGPWPLVWQRLRLAAPFFA